MQANAPPLAWDDVRVFLALARARTMSDAAATLGVDPSTVSRRLVALEARLDTVLFDRGRDGLRPTHAAEALVATAEQVEEGVYAFRHAAEGLERTVAGVVRVACPPDVADVILLPVLSRLLPRHPQLRVELIPGERTVDLARREADLALRVVRPTQGDLVVKRALDARWVLVAGGPLAARLGRLDTLADLPWIGLGSGLSQTPAAQWLRAHLSGDPVLRTDSLHTQIAAASLGLGVALVPAPSVAHYGLTALDLGDTGAAATPTLALYLVTHRALRRVPRIRVVWEAALAALAG